MSNKKYFLLTLAILLSLFCIIYLQQNVNRIREKDVIGTSISDLKDVPPIVAITTVAFGGFRGIVADILWLKTISLQEEGKYFEMIQLASWILKLQPKSVGAVSFLAWNMAYNISIIHVEPEKKWQWVENGINLLKNAIRYNPGNASLCKELAWLYINKIGDKHDSSNLYYKTQLALGMGKIIGNDSTTNQEFWESMTQIPSDYEECMEVLKNTEYKNIEDLYAVFKKTGRLSQQFESNFSDPKLLNKLILCLRKRMIKEEFGLNPEKIIEINKKIGELDWRLYSSLAIYWSYAGLSISKDSADCCSALNMALTAAVLNGRLLLVDDANANNFVTYPNFDAFPMINSYLIERLVDNRENRNNYVNFYFSFANKVIPILCLYGKDEYAKAMFDYIRNAYAADMARFATFDAFLDSCWNNYFENNDKEQILKDISQYIQVSCLLCKKGMPDLAETLKSNSKRIYDRYSKLYPTGNLPNFQLFCAASQNKQSSTKKKSKK